MARLKRQEQRQSVNEHVAAMRTAQAKRKTAAENRKALKIEQKARRKGEYGRVTPGNAKKALGVVKIVGPVLAPYALRAASAARERYDRMRARRLGVAMDDIGRFTGHGAALHARIHGDGKALRDLHEQAAHRDAEERVPVNQFVERTSARLDQLASAVAAAERIPAARRRATHRAVSSELSRIEEQLLNKFGV